MFKFIQPREKSGLEKAIDDLHKQMDVVMADTDEYSRMADQLQKLYKLREFDSRKPVSRDTLVVAATNLIGIAIIVGHERTHVVTSKALNFIKKVG